MTLRFVCLNKFIISNLDTNNKIPFNSFSLNWYFLPRKNILFEDGDSANMFLAFNLMQVEESYSMVPGNPLLVLLINNKINKLFL